jgi:hypothetical protein
MEELKELWQGVDVYNNYLKCGFNLGVTYLWSIHNYLAYGIFVGWCVHGQLSCLVYMDESNAFRMQYDRKDFLWLSSKDPSFESSFSKWEMVISEM